MVRLLLLLVAAPAALGLDNVNFLPHFRHGHHVKKHEHAHHAHRHSHEVKLNAEASSEVVKTAKPVALEASTPAATTTAAATPAATPAATTTPVVTAEKATTSAATTPAATTAAATTTPVPVVDVPSPSLTEENPILEVQPVDDAASGAGTSQLQVDLVEMKQNKVHITQLEQTLREDASLLRESSTLEHVSHSKQGHASAARQVKQAAQLVKGTEAMLIESRADAVEQSQAMIREAAAAREAADSLSAEAAEELKLFNSAQTQELAPKALREPVATPVTKPAEASSEEDIDIEDEN